MQKMMVIDGNSIMNRAFYGLQGSQLLSTSDGLYTNAIYGFINILFRYIDEEKPDYICVAFDLKAPTFRHIEYEGYKAHRKGMPEELRVQVPVLKEVIDAMNIKRLELEGYEADDILGTVSRFCEANDIETVIVTGDRDSYQLISDKTRIKIPLTRAGKTQTEEYTYEKFIETYGIEPTQFIDVKGIMGDASDNIPGVPGVGEKTALELVKQYKSIEEILNHAEELNTRKNVKESIISNKELAVLSKRLATINTAVPVEIHLEELKRGDFNNDKLYPLFKRLEFNSLIDKMGLKVSTESKKTDSIILREIKDFNNVLKTAQENKTLIYNIGYDISDKNKILGVAVAANDDISFISTSAISETELLDKLRILFESKEIKKVGNNIKHDIVALHSYGVTYENPYFDVSVASYILNPARENHELSLISHEFLNVEIQSESDFWGKGKSINHMKGLDSDELARFIGAQVECINKLFPVLNSKIGENEQEKLFYDIEMPLVEVLAGMEIHGFKVDSDKLKELSKELDQKIELLVKDIYMHAGEEFNINSTKQLGVILFDKLKLPVIKKTKTGYSTDAEVLETLAPHHEIVANLLEYRQLVKLKSTYAEGLLNVINPLTGKIHSSFNQTVTQTGRISSTEPNLQNIPIKLEMGRNFRKVFIASDDNFTLIDADYSQIELRVLAHIAEDEHMVEAFKNDIDIHRKTASEVFNIPLDEVTSTMRSRAKAVNFGIVYGIGDFSLAKDLGITRKEAKKYIDSYLENFTGVRDYMHTIVEIGKIKGYVTTLLNRRRYLPELKSSNFNIRSFGERIAMNTPIQGTAADIIKIAMVEVYRELKNRKLKSRLILQVHDELIVETHKDEIEIVKKIVQEKMTGALDLRVPLVIDMNMGPSWYDAK